MMSVWDDVDAYVTDLFVGHDLDFVLEASDAAGLPPIAVSAPQGKLLNLVARLMGARSILEVGTLGGYSTIWLARALPRDGRLVTLEYEPKHAEVAGSNLVKAGVADVVEIRVGAALDNWPDGEVFDLVFIDADKETYPTYFERTLDVVRPGSVIIADNVVRDGEVINTSTDDPRVQAMQKMNAMMAASPRVDATVLQTVGLKGYDGFAVALVVS